MQNLILVYLKRLYRDGKIHYLYLISPSRKIDPSAVKRLLFIFIRGHYGNNTSGRRALSDEDRDKKLISKFVMLPIEFREGGGGARKKAHLGRPERPGLSHGRFCRVGPPDFRMH